MPNSCNFTVVQLKNNLRADVLFNTEMLQLIENHVCAIVPRLVASTLVLLRSAGNASETVVHL